MNDQISTLWTLFKLSIFTITKLSPSTLTEGHLLFLHLNPTTHHSLKIWIKHIPVFFIHEHLKKHELLDWSKPCILPANISEVKRDYKRIFADLLWLVDLFFLAEPRVLCPTEKWVATKWTRKSLENSKNCQPVQAAVSAPIL